MDSQKVASRRLALRHAIVDSGLTQRRLARRLRIDETRFSRIVSGQVVPTEREAERIAKALGISPADVFAAGEDSAS